MGSAPSAVTADDRLPATGLEAEWRSRCDELETAKAELARRCDSPTVAGRSRP